MPLIKGVKVRRLQAIPDERGYLMELFRKDWEEFDSFAQSYITTCYPGIIKAWHYHKKQWDHFMGLYGMAKVVLHDPREESSTKGEVNVFYMGIHNPLLLKIPPLVYHGFTAIGGEMTMIINFPTKLYDYSSPDEFRLPYNDPSIPYNWGDIHG